MLLFEQTSYITHNDGPFIRNYFETQGMEYSILLYIYFMIP